MDIRDVIKDVMKGMEGIGGVPTNEEYYAEFDERLRGALGLIKNHGDIHHVSDCHHSWWWKLKNTIIGTICIKCRYSCR